MAEHTAGRRVDAHRPRPLRIDPNGTLHAGERNARFDTTDAAGGSLLLSYLRLVRAAREQRRIPVIELRRVDLEVLAAHLGMDTATVVDRLGELMGASVTQRRALVTLLASGVAVLTFAGGAVAAVGGRDAPDPAGTPPLPSRPPAAAGAAAAREVAPDVGATNDLHDAIGVVVISPPPSPATAPVAPAEQANVAAVETTVPAPVDEPVADPVTGSGEDPAREAVEVAVGEPPVPTAPIVEPGTEPEPDPEPEPEVAVGEPPVPVAPVPGGG